MEASHIQESTMLRKTVLGLVLAAASLGIAGPSFAQPRDRDQREEMRQDRRDGPHEREADRGHGQWERDQREQVRYGARGPEWHRGAHIPAVYRDRAYVVNDWRLHRLAPPPRGYQWVQVGPDYVLVTIGTGVIAQIVVG
jgi:Ni/Co efflux regulator RcnB